MKRIALCCLLMCSCVSEPVIIPAGPGGAIEGVDATGVTFTTQGEALWIKEGVPAIWFTATPAGPHLSNLYWHAGNSIRLKALNP